MTREQAIHSLIAHGFKVEQVGEIIKAVTPQKPQTFKWCTDCKEYDQEKHCCHRWSKVIRNTVEEMKQEYIEREVLDEIRAEIEELPTYDPKFEEKYTAYGMRCDVLEILDKYKAESEPQESEDKK